MNRILLACIALALPQFVAAAPCDILPYANQCQGSNLWPVPAGWAADNNGDCQPQLPTRVAGTPAHRVSWPGRQACTDFTALTREAAAAACCGSMKADQAAAYPYCTTFYPGEVYSAYGSTPTCDVAGSEPIFRIYSSTTPCQLPGQGWRSGPLGGYISTFENAIMCPAGYIHVDNTLGRECGLSNPVLARKPSNGVCTARWTSSAQTALEKDALDPDCDAQSCVFDGTCKLR